MRLRTYVITVSVCVSGKWEIWKTPKEADNLDDAVAAGMKEFEEPPFEAAQLAWVDVKEEAKRA